MSGLTFLKVFGDLCLCYAVLDAFPLLLVHDVLLPVQGLLCAGGVWLAELFASKEKQWMKFLAMVLPAASLLLADTVPEFFILLLGVIYSCLVIVRGVFALEYYNFRDNFQRTMTAYGIFAGCVFALGYFEGMFGTLWESFDITAVVMYGLLYALTGVFLLRQLRMGADSRARDRRLNAVQMAVVSAVILVLTVIIIRAEGLIHKGLEAIVYGIMVLVGVIPMVIHAVLQWFMRDNSGYMEAVGTAASPTYYTGTLTYPQGTGIVETPEQKSGSPWWLAVLVLAVMCVVLVFMLRSMHRETAAFASGEELEKVAPERSSPKRVSSNRNKVRRIYRSYLKYVRKKGQKLHTDQTSQYILDHAPSGLDEQGAEVLRQIYLKARYTEDEVTKSDVDRAKEALKKAEKYP